MTRKVFDAGVAHQGAQNSLMADDPVAAKAQYAVAWDKAIAAANNKPASMLPYTVLYLPRYLGDACTTAAAAVTAPNARLATLPEAWAVQLDSTGALEGRGYMLSDAPTNRTTDVHTASLTWSAQGLRYYKGYAWYTATVDIPATAAGQQVRLWLGIDDDAARVWVNGNELTSLTAPRALYPSSFAASPALRPGEVNKVVVKIANIYLDELGTGGLLSRSFIYTTGAAESAAPLAPVTGAQGPVQSRLTGDKPKNRRELPITWELLVTPYGHADRLGLWETGIPSRHFRSFDVTRGFDKQGLAHYAGGAVIRVGAQLPPQGSWLLHIPAADGAVMAWINEVPLTKVSGSSGGAWTFALPAGHAAGAQARVAISFDGGNPDPALRGIVGPISFIPA